MNYQFGLLFLLSLLAFAMVSPFLFKRLLYPIPKVSYTNSELDIIRIVSGNNQHISLQFLENQKATYTILYSHGNGEDLGKDQATINHYHQLGFSVAAYDYQGYGTSESKPSETALYQDISTVYEYLIKEKAIEPENIIVLGRSVGTGPSTFLASQKPIGGLILQSPYTSIIQIGLPVWKSNWDLFPTYRRIGQVDEPILFIHGEKDVAIPISHGKKLFELANEPKHAVWIENGTHNNLNTTFQPEVDKALFELIDEIEKQ